MFFNFRWPRAGLLLIFHLLSMALLSLRAKIITYILPPETAISLSSRIVMPRQVLKILFKATEQVVVILSGATLGESVLKPNEITIKNRTQLIKKTFRISFLNALEHQMLAVQC